MSTQASSPHTDTYAEMWHDSPLALFITRSDTVVYVNPAATRLLGSDLIGQPLQSVLPADRAAEITSTSPQTLRTSTGELFRAEVVRWLTRSGDNIFVLQQPIDSEKLQEALRHAAELSSILASIPDAVYVGDMDGIYICNRPALEMLGFDSPQELRESVGDLADRIRTRVPETGEQLTVEEQPFVCALRGEQTIREVLVHHLKTNRDVLVRCAAAPVYVDGNVIAAVAVNTDITETRKMERKLRETESLASAGRLAWQVAHEINNPLQAAMNLLSLAANGRLPDEERMPYLADAQAQLKRTADVLAKLIGLHQPPTLLP